MKTPIQTLIDKLEELKPSNGDTRLLRIAILGDLYELLEKEKQTIIDAYHEGKKSNDIHTVNETENWFNNTFKDN